MTPNSADTDIIVFVAGVSFYGFICKSINGFEEGRKRWEEGDGIGEEQILFQGGWWNIYEYVED